MKTVRNVLRDLVERRLWPVALLLVVAAVAVPIYLGRSSSDEGTTDVPVPSATAQASAKASKAVNAPSAASASSACSTSSGAKWLIPRPPRPPARAPRRTCAHGGREINHQQWARASVPRPLIPDHRGTGRGVG